MAIAKLKQGDTVIVLTGKDKGKRGKILLIKNEKAKVAGVNMVHKCVRRNPQQDEEGGIKKQEAFIHISNLAYWDDINNQRIYIGVKTLENGKRVRINKHSGELVKERGAK